jgi:hypothetical protein
MLKEEVASLTYEATCFNGFKDVSILVYVGEGFDVEAAAHCLPGTP